MPCDRHRLLGEMAPKKIPRVGRVISLLPTELKFETGPRTPKSQPTVSCHRYRLLSEMAPKKIPRVGHVTSLVSTEVNFETGPQTPKS